jgi:hypothetical protein
MAQPPEGYEFKVRAGTPGLGTCDECAFHTYAGLGTENCPKVDDGTNRLLCVEHSLALHPRAAWDVIFVKTGRAPVSKEPNPFPTGKSLIARTRGK